MRVRILFAGTPEPAVPSLRALSASGHEIAAVLTRPDAPVGRRRTLTPSPVKAAARELGLPVLEAARLRGEILAEIEALRVDAAAVVAYGALAGPRALSAARLGWFNLHFSLLPDYRGAAPVQRALIDGRTVSGLTVFRLDEGMDTGDIVAQRQLPLPPLPAGDVLADYARQGAPLLVEALDAVAAGTARYAPQPSAGTPAPKIEPAEARLDFSRPAARLAALARGTSPAPGPWALLDGQRTKVRGVAELPDAPGGPDLEPGELIDVDGTVCAGTGAGILTLESIQPFGKPMMSAQAFLRGRPGARFDAVPADVPEDRTAHE